MNVGVAGLGLIGGSLLRALGGVGYDADPAVRELAAAEGFHVAETLDGLRDADLVFVAVPPARTYDVVDAVLEAAPNAAVADTASVKGDVPERERFVAAHPMAGAESSGWTASSAELLRGATWAVCPGDFEALLRLGAAVDELGGRLVACDPRSHDRAVASTSHMPHVVASALAGAVVDPVAAALAGGAFRDMTRVARADEGLWTTILTSNRPYVISALDEFSTVLGTLREALDDPVALETSWAFGSVLLERLDAEPSWRDEAVDGWNGLVAHGLDGRAVRRLRVQRGELRAEVAR